MLQETYKLDEGGVGNTAFRKKLSGSWAKVIFVGLIRFLIVTVIWRRYQCPWLQHQRKKGYEPLFRGQLPRGCFDRYLRVCIWAHALPSSSGASRLRRGAKCGKLTFKRILP